MNHFTNMQNKHQTQESTRQSVMEAPTQTHMHMENTPQGPDGQRVSMCLITWAALATNYERVAFSEFLVSD